MESLISLHDEIDVRSDERLYLLATVTTEELLDELHSRDSEVNATTSFADVIRNGTMTVQEVADQLNNWYDLDIAELKSALRL